VVYLSTYGMLRSSIKQIKVLFVADPKTRPLFFSTILSIFFYNAAESVKEEKLIVLEATLDESVANKNCLITAVLPVPAPPINRMGFLLLR